MTGGAVRMPAGRTDSSSARAARRALRQLLAAKRQGDQESANLYAGILAKRIDLHLDTIRAGRS